jgi:hypothetical protein
MCSLRRKHHRIRITAAAKADIKWWAEFIQAFNGTVCFLHNTPAPSAISIGDACSTGGAATFEQDWFYVHWEADYPNIAKQHINCKELCIVILAARRWGKLWSNKHIRIYTDNIVTMCAINSGTSRNETAMCMLRELFWLSAINNFHISAVHIAGKNNIVSDYISRLPEQTEWEHKLNSWGLPTTQLQNHMSLESFLVLLQVHNKRNGQHYVQNAKTIREQHGPQQQSRHTHQCATSICDSAYTLVDNRSLLQKRPLCSTQSSSSAVSIRPACRDILTL